MKIRVCNVRVSFRKSEFNACSATAEACEVMKTKEFAIVNVLC